MKMSLENVQSIVRCPVCNKKYRPLKMLVLDEDDKRVTLHMTCTHCSVASIVFVSTGQFGIVSFGMLTDLEQSEAKQSFRGEAISSDHVIEAHQFLKQYTGGIEALIGK